MISDLFRQCTKKGERVKIILKTGQDVSGVIDSIEDEYVKVIDEGKTSIILYDMIGAWDNLQDTALIPEKKADVKYDRQGIGTIKQPADLYSKVIPLETRYDQEIRKAGIDIADSDIEDISDRINNLSEASVISAWQQIKNRYDYALKVKELNPRFGRIQGVIGNLIVLSEDYPRYKELKQALAYFYFVAEDYEKALKYYMLSEDWHNAAALALKLNNTESVCRCLGEYFMTSDLSGNMDKWYVFLKASIELNKLSYLYKVYMERKGRQEEADTDVLIESGIYLLSSAGQEKTAAKFMYRLDNCEDKSALLDEIVDSIKETAGDLNVRQKTEETDTANKPEKSSVQPSHKPVSENKNGAAAPEQLSGYIYNYKKDRNYGFIQDLHGNSYFFHRSAIIEEGLANRLQNYSPLEKISVTFSITSSPKGPIAIQMSMYKPEDELYALACNFANEGEYNKALANIKKVLTIDAEYKDAQQLYDKWREYEVKNSIPKGPNPYARAKRAQLVERELEKAVDIYYEAINQGDNVESAIKDLAMLLVQLNRAEQAIEVLDKYNNRITNKQSINNLLITIYQKAGRYDEVIEMLNKKYDNTADPVKKTQLLFVIANTYLKKGDYITAENKYREVLEKNKDNKVVKMNIGYCLIKRGEYSDAEKVINEILDTSPDSKAAELLEIISKAKETGKVEEADEIIINETLSELSTGELSDFTKFYCDRCNFRGVESARVRDDENGRKKYNGTEKEAKDDTAHLETIAKKLGSRGFLERSDYYLSAARISIDMGDERNAFYKYLCRSFASRGDAAVLENKPVDTIRQWYCEALIVFEGVRGQAGFEHDAINSLIRFLYSTLIVSQIPMSSDIPSIEDSIKDVLKQHPKPYKVFDAIGHLCTQSRYAANKILNRLYKERTLRAMSLEYLRDQKINTDNNTPNLESYMNCWNEYRRKKFEQLYSITCEINYFMNFSINSSWLLNGINRLKKQDYSIMPQLDQDRMGKLIKIIEYSIELTTQVAFEEQERLCSLIDNNCGDLLNEIESSPTKISIEELYPILTTIQEKVKEYLEQIYQSSAPQLRMWLPIELYIPDSRKINVQIAIENKLGCSPAESLELIVLQDKDNEELFTVDNSEIKLQRSLRGGERGIFLVPMTVFDKAIDSRTFSMTVYTQYRTRIGNVERTQAESYSIRLYSEVEFEEIDNPYAGYTQSGVVDDPDMFYGRGELIENISNVLCKSKAKSKSIIIYGQKRAGKSSILYHLKRKLVEEKGLIVLDIGNIGSIIDEKSKVPFLYQILWSIIRKLKSGIRDRIYKGSSDIGLHIPEDIEFFNHPSPLILFKDIFEQFRQCADGFEDWAGVKLVVMIDEFSYIYNSIVKGALSEDFMKNWKAILQENYFSVVLVGQDVMPKFKQAFPNEFGTTQDERVSYLKPEDAIKLIDEPIMIGGKDGQSRYRERAIERILDLTAGSPYYIQIICSRLVEYMNNKKASLVTEADVEQVKNELIKGVNALSIDKFDNLINSGDTSSDAIPDEDIIKVLRIIASNSKNGLCNRLSIACETKVPIDLVLDDLVKRDIIEGIQGQYYRLKIGLFREWLIDNKGDLN